jgi:hypothetical protein
MQGLVVSELVPLRNPLGFGPVDALTLAVALAVGIPAVLWRPWLAPAVARFARRTRASMLFLGLLPIVLRLVLLRRHPVPVPDLYDEFGHLLVARTLMELRLANPPHAFAQFFETFFVLQKPTYASIYPIGNGLAMAVGWFLFGTPWAGVLLGIGAFCALAYWMLRAWVSPGWALLGGLLAVFQFGPLNQWTNSYWGGGLSAAAGCLVFGALPRIRNRGAGADGVMLGIGLGIHLLTRPYESVFLLLAVALYLAGSVRTARTRRCLVMAAVCCLPAVGITILQDKAVTGRWLQLPYALSQERYGVPAVLTIQDPPVPTGPLTREQELDYRMQRGFHPGRDTLRSFGERLLFRVRYYRFYFLPPLYWALLAFLVGIRSWRWAYVPAVCGLFALGVNLFPAFQFHYVAAVVCLFLLMPVKGLERISRLGLVGARALTLLCVAQFAGAYGAHLLDAEPLAVSVRSWDLWSSINHGAQGNAERRIDVAARLAKLPGKLLVFVRYWPGHVFQDEWVYNEADIDRSRIVWARDLGQENRKLIEYYPDRQVWLLEPDARPANLEPYVPEPEPAVLAPQPEAPAPTGKKPMLVLEQVR